MEQRTPEWFAARCGKVTGSKIADMLAKTKTGYAASRLNYLAQLANERITGTQTESFTSQAMQWGTDMEPVARSEYETITGNLVDEIGFVQHPTIEMAGASPDGLVGEFGMLEIKCPNTGTHQRYLLGDTAPPEYYPQMQWQMACTGRQFCDFMSFDPRMPEGLQIFLIRVERDEPYIAEVEEEVIKFLSEVDSRVDQLLNRRNKTIFLEAA